MLLPLISERLTVEDDSELWDIAMATLLADALKSKTGPKQEIAALVGCCHHWISPHHPIRWVADGGFAWPFGYDKTTRAPS